MQMPKVKVVRLEKELVKAIRIIDKFLSMNKIEIIYTITLDYKMKNFGEFDPNKKNVITLNPAAFYDTKKEQPHAKYYSTDFTIGAVAIHEFSHMFDEKNGLLEKYRDVFTERFFVNRNAEKDYREELAELLSLYILNPYFLKLINKERFDFFNKLFESPTKCTKANFVSKWESWPDKIKELCMKKWGINVTPIRRSRKSV